MELEIVKNRLQYLVNIWRMYLLQSYLKDVFITELYEGCIYCSYLKDVFIAVIWRMYLLQSYFMVKKRHWDPAKIWTWVFRMPVRGSYQLSHWSSGIGAEDRRYISIDTAQLSDWISCGVGTSFTFCSCSAVTARAAWCHSESKIYFSLSSCWH